MSTLVWYAAVLTGWPMFGLATLRTLTGLGPHAGGSFVMVTVLILGLALVPLVQGRGHDSNGVIMSTAFICAVLIIWGPWPAIALQGAQTLVSDLRARKNWRRWLFNPPQQALSWLAAAIVAAPLHQASSLTHPLTNFRLLNLVWVAVVCVVYVMTNMSLVVAVLTFSGSFGDLFVDDLGHYSLMMFSVLAMSPLVVVLAHQNWPLLPLLLVPLLLLYYTAQTALQREHDAGHDSLTGLPNRATLNLDLADAFDAYAQRSFGAADAGHSAQQFALMLIDLNGFKQVNDTLGHHAGDALLCEVGRRLAASLRESDNAARLGGDEFAVLIRDVDETEAVEAATRISNSVTGPISVDDARVDIGWSMGIALCPQHGTDPATLLRHADAAMYAAKTKQSVIEVYARNLDREARTRIPARQNELTDASPRRLSVQSPA